MVQTAEMFLDELNRAVERISQLPRQFSAGCGDPALAGGPAQSVRSARLDMPFHGRYDASMTRSKIAISLPKDQLMRVHREVRAGRADSVSGYITRVLAEHEKRESLRALLRDLTEQYGEPAAKDIKWAERVLAPRRG